MRILNSCVVLQDSISKPGCAPAGPATHFLYSTARIRQDISAASFCSCDLLGRSVDLFYSLFQRATRYLCTYELLCRSIYCIFLRYPSCERC